MVDIYSAAWKRGLKTTYYLHVKPRHSAEQSTVKVNKAESTAGSGPRKTGFGFARKQEVGA
jgi:ribonucleoside-diphosphate reductase alpha chain